MSKDNKEWITGAFIGIGLAGLGFFGALAAASATLGGAAIPVWGIAIGIVAVVVRSPAGIAFAKRLSPDSDHESEPMEVPPELYAELDEMRARLLEVEERQDFAERLLAERTPPEQGS